MGSYNPDAPIILGEEWVGIRDENLELSPATNFIESGHGFTLATTRLLQEGRYYVNTIRPLSDRGQNMGMAIYPAGTEALSGPVKSVIIPCNSASVTGGSVLGGAATAVAALLSPTDGFIFFAADSATTMGVRIGFAVNSYPQLNGKRILGINILHRVSGSDSLIGPGVNGATQMVLTTEFSALPTSNFVFYDRIHSSPTGEIVRVPLGEINPFWTATSPITNSDRMHWTYAQLQRLDTTTPWLFVTMTTGTSINSGAPVGSSMSVNYVALEVFYCEEQRVAFGAIQLGGASNTVGKDSINGANIITMRSMSYVANPPLPAGNYTAVITSPYVGSQDIGFIAASNYPLLNAERQLYPITPHPGVQVNIPFPLDDTAVDRVLTKQTIQVLPQLSLHTTGSATFTEPHAYGRQALAQVYGTNTAVQDIDQTPDASVSYNYPWVRFYARRFGNTTIPLTLTGSSPGAGLLLPGTAGNYASTPDNAVLDITGDIDIKADVTMTAANWATGTVSFVAKWDDTTQRSYWFGTDGAGHLRWRWSTTGANLDGVVSTAVVTVPSTGRLAVRIVYDANNGAAGNTTVFYTAPTLNGPWTQLGAPVVAAGVVTMFSSTAVLEVGSIDNGASPFLPGTVHAVEVLNSVGTTVANPNFASQPPGTTTFVDGAGRTWTLNGTASIVSGLTTSTVSITPAAFDALTEIIDGWKEVTLRFTTIPAMGTLGTGPAWTWSATGEVAGNRWEVLGAVAPALSGIAGNLFNLAVPAASQLGSATYGGSTMELTWMPQGVGSPYVAAPSEDVTADGVLMFSQDAPSISGFSISTLSQAVSGIGQECGLNPCCIPTAIQYNRLTWTASTGPYVVELQRMDTVDTDWQTIMMHTSPASGAGTFNDYEARVGILSSYRIREVNAFGFPGLWSSTITATISEPGVTIGCTGHILIFTSNEVQDGSRNLAYSSAWQGQVEENFSFPEAGTVQLQAMYDRDFVTAFRSTERGGERFERELLIQAAAIAPPTLADFHGLRDMAWADLSYVCVRDDDGNRWFATVVVPSGRVMHFRKIYTATVGVIEVTDTPSQVSP